jgi:quercetin 2,3-dioxygenase
MIIVRSSQDRGRANFGWLDSRHTFSFGGYVDPEQMGFGPLRVINEDKVAPGKGFATHGHADMEIISYVLDGALEHKDSIGNGSVIRPGDIQRMSAGTGIQHSEYNASPTDTVHFLQIWILPGKQGIDPGYEQKHFAPEDLSNQLRLVGSQGGRQGSVTIHQDVDFYTARLSAGQSVEKAFAPGRLSWLQVARGSVQVNDQVLEAGDGAAIDQEPSLLIQANGDAEILLFDMVAY